jgi:hypothetical protein
MADVQTSEVDAELASVTWDHDAENTNQNTKYQPKIRTWVLRTLEEATGLYNYR